MGTTGAMIGGEGGEGVGYTVSALTMQRVTLLESATSGLIRGTLKWGCCQEVPGLWLPASLVLLPIM